jgi:hypothetical protein
MSSAPGAKQHQRATRLVGQLLTCDAPCDAYHAAHTTIMVKVHQDNISDAVKLVLHDVHNAKAPPVSICEAR